MKEEKIIVFETYTDPIKANIIKGLLESYGIECFLADENMVNINAMYSQAIGGVKLNVFEKDVEQILTILNSENSAPEPIQTTEKETDSIHCPSCQSTNVGFGGSIKKKFGFSTVLSYSLIISFLFMIYPFQMRKVYHCFNCGHEFKKNKNRFLL